MYLIQKLASIGNEVNVVGVCRVEWHFVVFSRELRQVVSQITAGCFQVDHEEYRRWTGGVPMVEVNVGHLPRFNLGSNVNLYICAIYVILLLYYLAIRGISRADRLQNITTREDNFCLPYAKT